MRVSLFEKRAAVSAPPYGTQIGDQAKATWDLVVGSTRHGCGLHNVQQRAKELKSRESSNAWVEEDSQVCGEGI